MFFVKQPTLPSPKEMKKIIKNQTLLKMLLKQKAMVHQHYVNPQTAETTARDEIIHKILPAVINLPTKTYDG